MSSTKIQQMLFERVVKEFGGDHFTLDDLNTRCGLNDQEIKGVKTTKTKTIPEEHLCCARIWDKDSDDKRCSKRRFGDNLFCAGHGRLCTNKDGIEFDWQKCGRIDEPVPMGYRAEKKIKKDRKNKKNVEPDGVQKPKKALTSYFCFMNAMRQQVKDANPGDKVGDIAKKLDGMWKSMGEEEKKPYQEMSAKDKERHLMEMEEFHKTNVVVAPKVESPVKVELSKKVALPDKSPVKDQLVDEAPKEPVEVVDEAPKEPVEVVDDDEVDVVEFKYKGTTYLLDPDSNKVYNMEQEFAGKLEGKKINFSAIDSDDEE